MKFFISLAIISACLIAGPVLAGPCSQGPPYCRGKWNSDLGVCEEPYIDNGPGNGAKFRRTPVQDITVPENDA